MSTFQTAETFYPAHAETPGLSAPERVLAHHWPKDRAPFNPPSSIHPVYTAEAHLNHGRWVVHCPGWPDCMGAQMASYSDRKFFCVNCLGLTYDCPDSWVAVLWPEDSFIAEMTPLLLRRPIESQNWSPGDTILKLEQENLEHGLIP